MAAVTGSVGHFFYFFKHVACTFIPQIHKSRVQSATESHKTTKHLHRVRPSEKKLRTLRAACAPHQL